MEDIAALLLGALAGLAGYVLGTKLQPKNKDLTSAMKWYKEELDTMRNDLRRYRAKVTYFQKGAVPADLLHRDGDHPDALIDGIIQALPSNFRSIIGPFKGEILKYMKENPEQVDMIKKRIAGAVGGNGRGQEKEEQYVDSL